MRVLVVDGDDRVRESLRGLLGIGKRLVVVGDAGRPDMALELVASTSPDVVIVDPRLPDIDGGLTFIARLRATAPRVCVLAMSCTDGPDKAALEACSDGCVRKTFRPSELVAAIEAGVRPPG